MTYIKIYIMYMLIDFCLILVDLRSFVLYYFLLIYTDGRHVAFTARSAVNAAWRADAAEFEPPGPQEKRDTFGVWTFSLVAIICAKASANGRTSGKSSASGAHIIDITEPTKKN